jgi:hypothetical protein
MLLAPTKDFSEQNGPNSLDFKFFKIKFNRHILPLVLMGSQDIKGVLIFFYFRI